MKPLLILISLLLAGCNVHEPEGKLIGTMSMYRTPTGSIVVVNDQDGNKMEFNFHLNSVLILEPAKESPTDHE
tara:strand:+ start:57 stop:275 length:219 start_codon:yes stop_codon:yes gene_type:complete